MMELTSAIEEYLTMEKYPRNREYWDAITTILKDCQSKSSAAPESRAVDPVAEDIKALLGPKTHDQLLVLESQIQRKLSSDEPVDVDYWQQLLRGLKIFKAKAKIRAIHAPVLEARPPPPRTDIKKPRRVSDFDASKITEGDIHDELLEDNEAFQRVAATMFDTDVTRIVEEGVETEENYNVEAEDVVIPTPSWTNEYTARKPKFFNRVVMGYEWNKYNQTHYDESNPPPQVVQGYKFNIFYPNLVDTSKTPTYKVERNRQKRRYVGGGGGTSAGEDDVCVLRFSAGPPYLDIAFRIIDRDWDYSSRFNRGFKSSFDKVYDPSGWGLMIGDIAVAFPV
jgi:cactin